MKTSCCLLSVGKEFGSHLTEKRRLSSVTAGLRNTSIKKQVKKNPGDVSGEDIRAL